MNIQLHRVLLSLLVTLSILFGGFFAYQTFYIKRSIQQSVQKTPHVTIEKLEVSPKEVQLQLKIDQQFPVHSMYVPLYQRIKSYVGNRELRLQIQDQPDHELQQAWSQMLFGIREGLAQQRYTQVLHTVEKVAENQQIDYQVNMDQQYLYVHLRKGNHFLTKVISLDQESRAMNKAGSEVKNIG
ncbi:hypothetical protein [Thermoflavimicrobium dichotomicum]|uniref:Uncharacterized protein n=1 Tax=Thermoflavimicrobium dichotomicum TaxID=46223 RepID=A0A1I3TDD9_9BACL|nr:hypothetical protein [Thermoflavimicrobium dichotomicum]SFJ69198.1 hypothetical protein SAMN05421852_11731 [Thermoflavimicrobium dichotomicum]